MRDTAIDLCVVSLQGSGKVSFSILLFILTNKHQFIDFCRSVGLTSQCGSNKDLLFMLLHVLYFYYISLFRACVCQK